MSPRTLHKVGTGIVYLLVLVMLVGAGGVLVLRLQGIQLMSVHSDSMSPTIRHGDAVAIQRDLSVKMLAVGDSVSFRSPEHDGVIITHRIVAIDTSGQRLVTKGDATTLFDKPIKAGNVVGKVERVVPFGGYLLDVFKHPFGLALLVYLPTLCIVAAEIQHLSRYYRVAHLKHYRLYGHST